MRPDDRARASRASASSTRTGRARWRRGPRRRAGRSRSRSSARTAAASRRSCATSTGSSARPRAASCTTARTSRATRVAALARAGRHRLPEPGPPDLRGQGPRRGGVRAADPRAARAAEAAAAGDGRPRGRRAERRRPTRTRTTSGYSRRKLLAIASVLAMDTPVVVLDEPTTGQDARGVARVQAVLANLVGGRPHGHRDQPRHALRRRDRSRGSWSWAPAGSCSTGRPAEVFAEPRLAGARLDLPRAAVRGPGRGAARPGLDADGGLARRSPQRPSLNPQATAHWTNPRALARIRHARWSADASRRFRSRRQQDRAAVSPWRIEAAPADFVV